MDTLEYDDKLQNWLREISVRSRYKLYCHNLGKADCPIDELDEVSGWKSYLGECVKKEADELHLTRGFFLTGKSGNGKRTAAYDTALYLADNDGWLAGYGDGTDGGSGAFDVLLVDNTDFTLPDVSPEDCIDFVLDSRLCDEKNRNGLCLIMESPEKIPDYENFLKNLGYLIISYRCNPETNTLVFFIISDTLDEASLPQPLRNQVQVCRVLSPNEKRREKFWTVASRESADVRDLLDGRTPADMASLTNGMTYRELYDTVMLACRAGKNYNIDIAWDNLEFEIQRLTPAKEDERDILYKKLVSVIDKLPALSERFIEAVENISVPSVPSVTAVNAVSSKDNTKGEANENTGIIDKLGADGKYLRDGIDENALQNGDTLDVFDRDKFDADFEEMPLGAALKAFEVERK